MSQASQSGQANSEAFHHFLMAALATWDKLVEMVATQPVLQCALVAMAMVLLGSRIRGSLPTLGGFMRFLGNFGLILALLATMAGLVDLSQFGLSGTVPDVVQKMLPKSWFPDGEAQVEGKNTRIAISRDGHFWAKARINGVAVRFLVDTGATLTTLSPEMARKAGIKIDAAAVKVDLKTANGASEGVIVQIGDLRLGNIRARKLQAVIAPGIGGTNVLGMNFLSRLESWRVEGGVLTLVPHKRMLDKAGVDKVPVEK